MINFQDLLNRATTKAQGFVMAGQEALPAILGGVIGRDRVDTSVDPRMGQGLINAYRTAQKRGSDVIDYEDYDMSTPGGIGAKYTFGTVGKDNLRFDQAGNVVGIRGEKYDTDKTPMQALREGKKRLEGGDITAGIYKPFEALLGAVQGRGLTTHNVDFQQPVAPKPTTPVNASAPNLSPTQPEAYRVKSGDTLSAIAKRLGTTVEDLARKNQIRNVNQIQIGQQIRR
tara:strand:+ start:2668 stop:3351 length:684 start_codon:yes stop_codon:yes gene_type:complete